MNKKKVALMILDGLGYGKHDKSNAVEAANTPFLDHLLEAYPNSSLEASGEAVGLPAGQMGNSEVGHMNLGAGRIVYFRASQTVGCQCSRVQRPNPCWCGDLCFC